MRQSKARVGMLGAAAGHRKLKVGRAEGPMRGLSTGHLDLVPPNRCTPFMGYQWRERQCESLKSI